MLEVKNRVLLAAKKEDREYSFDCAANGSLGEIFDVLSEMRGWVAEKIQEGLKVQEEQGNPANPKPIAPQPEPEA